MRGDYTKAVPVRAHAGRLHQSRPVRALSLPVREAIEPANISTQTRPLSSSSALARKNTKAPSCCWGVVRPKTLHFLKQYQLKNKKPCCTYIHGTPGRRSAVFKKRHLGDINFTGLRQLHLTDLCDPLWEGSANPRSTSACTPTRSHEPEALQPTSYYIGFRIRVENGKRSNRLVP